MGSLPHHLDNVANMLLHLTFRLRSLQCKHPLVCLSQQKLHCLSLEMAWPTSCYTGNNDDDDNNSNNLLIMMIIKMMMMITLISYRIMMELHNIIGLALPMLLKFRAFTPKKPLIARPAIMRWSLVFLSLPYIEHAHWQNKTTHMMHMHNLYSSQKWWAGSSSPFDMPLWRSGSQNISRTDGTFCMTGRSLDHLAFVAHRGITHMKSSNLHLERCFKLQFCCVSLYNRVNGVIEIRKDHTSNIPQDLI